MRVEVNLPDNREFHRKLEALVKASNRPSRKNFLENLIIRHVDVTQIKSSLKVGHGKIHSKPGR